MTGVEIRAFRKKLGWTQMALADAIGVTSNTVARWERGEMAISERAARLVKNRSRAMGAEWEETGGLMASIKRCHQAAWVSPSGMYGERLPLSPATRFEFPAKKAAEKHLSATARWRAYHRSSTRAGAFETRPSRSEVFSHWFKDADTGAVDRFAQGFGKSEESGQKSGH
jgi:transcriptional regulator with XRE-family HTH domain